MLCEQDPTLVLVKGQRTRDRFAPLYVQNYGSSLVPSLHPSHVPRSSVDCSVLLRMFLRPTSRESSLPLEAFRCALARLTFGAIIEQTRGYPIKNTKLYGNRKQIQSRGPNFVPSVTYITCEIYGMDASWYQGFKDGRAGERVGEKGEPTDET